MKFGIIVCPRCKKAKGVDILSKTTKCIGCGKTLRLDTLKILYKTDSRQELQNALGLINADMDGKLKDFKKIINQQ
jgi:hypothetical protein